MRTKRTSLVLGSAIAGVVHCLAFANAGAEVSVTQGTNISVHVSTDGRLVTDLLGGVWVIPRDGGEAHVVASGVRPASRPRWSPSGDSIAYQSGAANGSQIWQYRFDDQKIELLSKPRDNDQHPDWHPGDQRLIFSSARAGQGFDLWEMDLETRLAWRLTSLSGDETEPAWSTDGRSLVYIHEHAGRWSLMLRRLGEADEAIATSTSPLAAPAWRPDGSLVTYLRRDRDGWSISMTILSRPRLNRPLITAEDIFLSPIAWLDRQQMVYAADGQIKKRLFDSRTSAIIPFRALVGTATEDNNVAPVVRELPAIEEPAGKTVIRAARLFDGLGDRYRGASEILIDGGRIVAISDRAAATDSYANAIVVDLGDITVMPGFIDAYASLPASTTPGLGPLLLSMGVTTLVADHVDGAELDRIWSQKETPGPRVLRAASAALDEGESEPPWLISVSGDMASGESPRKSVQEWRALGVAVLAESWQAGLGSGATLMLGADNRPVSPGGRRYQDVLVARGDSTIKFISGIADAQTPNIADIWSSRQAPLIAERPTLMRRFTSMPNLSAASSTIVLGSRPNGLPPGIALHAELRALAAAGLNEAQTLRAAGVNAAAALSLGLRLGRIAPGASADLVLVDGDPLGNIDDALKIVGVVRNGRFFSVSGLIDKSAQWPTVD